jgi:energy-coupling factor transport system permease protein
MFHPATWIALWSVFALFLQLVTSRELAWLALPAIALAGHGAPRESLRLLRRARWLLLTIAILFSFATPGERLPAPFGTVGMTVDGLAAAAEHLLRLVALLATLAWLWRAIGRDGLMAGLHCLSSPLGARRDRLVVRLALALDYAERETGKHDWRAWLDAAPAEAAADGPLRLAVRPLAALDRVALAGCGAALLLMLLR